jgi:hypothetical protein
MQSACPFRAKVRHCALPLGCFVGAAKARERHGDAKCFHGFEVDAQLDVGCLLGREVRWIFIRRCGRRREDHAERPASDLIGDRSSIKL